MRECISSIWYMRRCDRHHHNIAVSIHGGCTIFDNSLDWWCVVDAWAIIFEIFHEKWLHSCTTIFS